MSPDALWAASGGWYGSCRFLAGWLQAPHGLKPILRAWHVAPSRFSAHPVFAYLGLEHGCASGTLAPDPWHVALYANGRAGADRTAVPEQPAVPSGACRPNGKTA